MRKPYDEYGNESEFGGIDWGALLGVQNDPVGGMMSAAQVIPQVIPQVAQQASKSGLGFNVPTTMVQNQPASGIAPAGQLPTQFDVFGNPIFNIDWGVGGAAMSAGTNYANNILAQQDAQRNSIFADQTRLAGANTAGMVTPEMQAWIARNIGGNTGEAAPSGFDALNAHFTAQSGDDAPYGSWNVAQGGTNAGYGKANDIRRDTTAENAKTVRTILSQMFPNATTGQMDAAANAAMQASVGDAGHYTEVHNPIDIVTGIAQQMGGVPQQFQANLDAMRPQFNQRIEQITAARNGNEDAADQLPAYVKMIAAAAGGLVLGPALGAAFGGGAAGAGTLSGALGSAAGNFIGSGITSALTGGNFLRDGLLSGAAAGIGNYASSLNGGANFVGPMPDSVLPSTAQLVKTGGSAAINMLAGQDPTQALAGAGLNLAGITGNNTLKDAGLDPRLAGVATSAGLGLLTGRDPSSIALSSLPALGSYAGSLLGSPSSASTESSGNPTEWTPDNAQWLQNLTGQIAAQGNPAQSFDMGDTSWLDSLISNNTGASDMSYTLPPPGNNPDELGGLFDDTQLPPFNMSDYLPSDLGQVAPDGNLPGTNSSWQSLLDSPINANLSDPSYLGGYGNTADANSGSGLSAFFGRLLGTGAAGAAGSASGVGLGTLLGGALGLGGAYLQGNAATNAANTNANAQIEAAKIAADAAKFRPIGITTRFGSSNFTKDANGNVTGAGYNLSPEMLAQQNQLMGISGNALTQFGNAQTATAPMGDAAGRMMTLGNQYLATSPQAQAQKYMAEQQALLATGRERDLNQMLTGEFNRGTYGLSTGGTSTGMNGANPRLEAMFNAQRQQDLGLASQATQGGMDYAKFGAGMVGSGGDMLRGMYGVQSAAYDPYKTALGGATMIEGLGQNALDSGVNMGKMTSNAQSGQLLAQGMSNAANTMQQANSYSPWGGLLSGASNQMQNYQNNQAQQAQNQQMMGMLSKIWGTT